MNHEHAKHKAHTEMEKSHSEGFRVAMVGDGINDAPALVTADRSF